MSSLVVVYLPALIVLGSIPRILPLPSKTESLSWTWWCTPVIAATGETEAGRLKAPV